MKLKIIEERENPFFNRVDVKVEVEHEGEATPSKAALMERLASRFKTKAEMVKIDYILTGKGKAVSFAKVKVLKKPKKS